VSTIDRIRYYDGEFLRAFDFSDEQTYHVEMRRRLNRYLHLCGIVQGLTLVSPEGSDGVSILPGMAIDALGREIYVYAPYTLGDGDVTTNRITIPGTYDVWLRYQKSPGTPPSSGYGNCNQTNQYTRWVESFSVSLLPSPSSPFTTPGFAETDTDDPGQDQVGVLLGTVSINPTSSKATFSSPQFNPRCKLLGVVAQRIHTPPGSDTAQVSSLLPQFNFWNQPSGGLNTPLTPPVSLEIKPNIFAERNLIVGPDFPLAPNPTVTVTPNPVSTAGSVKIAGDLFVQGNIYSPTTTGADTQWNGLSTHVQQLVKASVLDVLTDSEFATIPFPMPPSGKGFTSSKLLTSTRLSSFSNVVPIAFLLSSSFDPAVSPGSQVSLSIDSIGFTPNPPTSNQVTVNTSWTALPVDMSGKCAFKSFSIFFVAVCFA